MYKALAPGFLLLLSGWMAQSDQAKVSAEKQHIKEMCGCYEVHFEYAETFSPLKDYEYHDRYAAKGLEWIFVDEEKEQELVLQHLLVAFDTMVIKHWRQDWLFENTSLLDYERKLEWSKKTLSAEEAKGTWTQKVYQVDDSPRYQGYATWVTVDQKKYWESQVSAPLPRREYTKRNDYNVMLRNNKHKITANGHVHELDNAKIVRTAKGDSVLAWEKGMNTYTRVDDSLCQAARDWWSTNRKYWVDVRAVWDEVIGNNDYINLKNKVEGKKLWQRLFELGDELIAAESYSSKKAKKQILETIDLYLTDEPTPWVASETKAKAEQY